MYLVKTSLRHNRIEYGVGNLVELSDEHAAPLLKVGAVERYTNTSATESGKAKAPAAGSSAAGAEPNGSDAPSQPKVSAAAKVTPPKGKAGKKAPAKPSAA